MHLSGVRPSVCPSLSVCPIRPLHAAAAGLLLCCAASSGYRSIAARPAASSSCAAARCAAGNAGSATLSADLGSRRQTCFYCASGIELSEIVSTVIASKDVEVDHPQSLLSDTAEK